MLAFERRASCRASGSVLPWLYGIATNVLRRSRRAERRQLRAYGRSGVDQWAVYEDEAAARVDGSALDARLARALAAMRPRERDALLLYALADLSYEEIAFALDIPIGTVRTWIHRARRTARAYSRRRRRFSLSRQQELIYMAELDRFQDFRSGVAAPSEDARRRAAARLQGAIEGKHRHGGGAMRLVRRRPGRTVLALAALATAVGTALFVSAPWKTSPGFLERAQAALTAPADTILHMKWESGLNSIDPTCTITRLPGDDLPGPLPGAVEVCPTRWKVCPNVTRSTSGLHVVRTRPGSTKRRRTGSA